MRGVGAIASPSRLTLELLFGTAVLVELTASLLLVVLRAGLCGASAFGAAAFRRRRAFGAAASRLPAPRPNTNLHTRPMHLSDVGFDYV